MHSIYDVVGLIAFLIAFCIIVFLMYAKVEFKTNCIWCLFFGHKWWLTARNDVIEDGQQYRRLTHTRATHCQRCGEPNPDKTVIATKEVK